MKIFVFLCLFLFISCSDEKLEIKKIENNEIPQVEIMKVKTQNWVQHIHTYGFLEAANEINISVDFSAKVKNLHIKEGIKVTKGSLLVEFEDEKLLWRAEQSASAVKSAHANLEEARLELVRQEKLYRSGSISTSNWDSINLNFKRATAQYEDVLAAEKIIQKELADSKIYSPVDGVIFKKNILNGEMSVPGVSFITLQTIDNLKVITYVSEKEVNYLRLRSKATVESPGARGRKLLAYIESIATDADRLTGNFQVKLVLSNKEKLLRPGMTAQITMEGMEIKNAIIIPEKAMVDRNRRKVIFVVENSHAVQIEPAISMYSYSEVLVFSGLKPDDMLIIAGTEIIKDGSAVDVKEQQ